MISQKYKISKLGKQMYRMPASCAMTLLSKISFLFRGVRDLPSASENSCHGSGKEACSVEGQLCLHP